MESGVAWERISRYVRAVMGTGSGSLPLERHLLYVVMSSSAVSHWAVCSQGQRCDTYCLYSKLVRNHMFPKSSSWWAA